ncbi:MAG: hypothetical protein KJO29_01300, partial [Bacteroidia bacterium]|nr:hypothetical protein [Bacteroidia bacterium]
SGLISTVSDDNANVNVQTIATHTSGDGTVTAIEETITGLADNGDGTFTYTSENGTATTFDSANETLTSISLNGDNASFDYIDEDGITTNINLCTIVDNCETVTSLTFDAINNRLQYSDEFGTLNNIDLTGLISTMVDNNANVNVQTIATHTSGDGTVTAIEETVTTLVDNGDDTFTYTSEDGTITTIDHKEIFYPPSVPIDVSATGTGLTLDLHQEYINQYGSPAVSSTGAPAAVPTYVESDLYYYVLDYDTSILNVTSITADGIMTYDIIAVPVAASCTYINVVFVEK